MTIYDAVQFYDLHIRQVSIQMFLYSQTTRDHDLDVQVNDFVRILMNIMQVVL